MKIDEYTAEMETPEEASMFGSIDGEYGIEELMYPVGTEMQREQILSAIRAREGGPAFFWRDWLDMSPPQYGIKAGSGDIKHFTQQDEYGIVSANALTIGKDVGELRALLKWCNS